MLVLTGLFSRSWYHRKVMHQRRNGRPPRTLYLGVLLAFFALLSLGSWALSSPVGSSPDDNFHLASIWCGQGTHPLECEQETEGINPLVPAGTFDASSCFAFRADIPADCQSGVMASTALIPATASNAEKLYPPLFYWVMNTFVSPNIETSVLLMRLANSALLVILSAALWMLLPTKLKRLPVVAIALTSVPLGMFIIPSTNPSSWAVISAGTLFFALVGAYTAFGWRRALLIAIAGISVVIGAGARADSGLYAVISTVSAFIIFLPNRRGLIQRVVLTIALAVASVLFMLSSSQFGKASAGLEGANASDLDTVGLITSNIIRAPYLWSGVFGTWGLGWLDTPMPTLVPLCALLALLCGVIPGIRLLRRWDWVSLIPPVVALIALPAYVLVQSHAVVGVLVQPRYIYPLIVLIVGISILGWAKTEARPRLWWGITSASLLSVANSIALHQNIQRYVQGLPGSGFNLDSHVVWWWPLGPSPQTVWVLGSVFFAVSLMLLLLTFFIAPNRQKLINYSVPQAPPTP